MNLGYYSYLAAAFGYGIFIILLLFSWRGTQAGRLLAFTVFIGMCWSFTASQAAADDVSVYLPWYKALEVLRYACWYLFLIKLLDQLVASSKDSRLIINFLYSLSAILVVTLLFNEFLLPQPDVILRYTGHVFLGLFGLVIIEQLFRNSDARNRWSFKYLFLGAGAMFAYDFYLYADALLFMGVDKNVWEARGILHLTIIPLLVVATSRNKNWTIKVFVSRDVVFNTTAILLGGIYLLAMSAAGYYLREFGGDWGRVGELVFICLALIAFASLIFSTSLRSKARVFLGKHFYKNKYDYRLEWLRLTEGLGGTDDDRSSNVIAIETIAKTVEARAGMLWLEDESGSFRNTACWKMKSCDETLSARSSLVRFLVEKTYVINLFEIDSHTREYQGLDLPDWVQDLEHPWLIVPLINQGKLVGFIMLSSPLVVRNINWEDRDLLKTAARQVANFIMASLSSEALAEAKQFEVFTRLSAYMVHDLKNIASELEMVAQNAKKHRDNPEFIDDAFSTVDNASGDIKRLLNQLRNRQAQVRKNTLEDLGELLGQAAHSRSNTDPRPTVDADDGSFFAVVEKDRLLNVLGHLIENAQQATEDDGSIRLSIENQHTSNIIRIEDSGHGMDAQFIKDRLFKPFDTTKGNAGMGIGMYESREFIRQLGGDIKVDSEPQRGTVISLYIPVASDTEMHEQTSQQ